MPTILMTNVRSDEQPAINAFAKSHNITIKATAKSLKDVFHLLPEVDGVIIQQRGKLPDETYALLEQNNIKQITTRTAGYDMIDVASAHKHHLKVTNVPAYSPRSVAEHALMQIFRLIRHEYTFDARVAKNDYRWTPDLQGREIHTVTVGIIGVGRIGGTLASLLHALGAKVIGYDTKPNVALANIVEFKSKEEVLAQSDVISLHVNLNETSKNLLTKADFAKMKPTACLVNASRGPVVNTADLVAALKSNQIAAAALDTITGEADLFNVDHSQTGLGAFSKEIQTLHAMENVILTPHIAFFTNVAVKNMVDISLTDVLTILAGKTSAHEIDA